MKWPLLLLLTTAGAPALGAQDFVVQLAGRDVAIWKPPTTARAPMVIYSHGFGGCNTQPAYLLQAIADNGYWVVSPRHDDAGCGRRTARALKPAVSFSTPARWTDATFANRRDDIRAVERALKSDPRFRDRIDFTRFAYAGHSLGGYTAVALAGGWSSWRGDAAPSAVLALCPFVSPFVASATMDDLRVPVMFQNGDRDAGITREVERRGGAYDAVRDAKYLVVFRNAGHLTWGGRDNPTHEHIVRYAVAFLDRYVKGTPASATLTSGGDVADFRYDSELGKRVRGER